MPLAQPMACQRSSSSTTRSRYERTFGSSKTRAAVSNETPCFRRLMRFLFSSHAKTMCIYKSVAHRPQGFAGVTGSQAVGATRRPYSISACMVRAGRMLIPCPSAIASLVV